MAVVLCTNSLSGRTGLHKSVAMTANHLHRAGYPVTVITFLGSGDGSQAMTSNWPLDYGLPAYALRSLPAQGGDLLYADFHSAIKGKIPKLEFSFTANGLAALRQLNATLDCGDSIIFSHPIQAAVFKRAIGSDRRRARTIMQIHGDYEVRHPELIPLLDEASTVIDHVQVVSQGMRDSYAEMFGADRVKWIPNIHEPLDVRPLAHSGVRVALIGSFQEAKNQLDAVRMLEMVDDESIELVFWGNHNNEYADELRRLLDDLSLGHRVTLPGPGSEREIYESTDIVIIPSLSEGFGYPLLEAATHGIPVVAYDYDYGPRDVIADGRSGFIVPLGDTRAMANRVTELARTTELRAQMGEEARRIFEREFAPDRVVAAYASLIGEPTNSELDIPTLFEVNGSDPVPAESIQAKLIHTSDKGTWFHISFTSSEKLHNFEAATTRQTRRLRAVRLGSRYHLALRVEAPDRKPTSRRPTVISYEVVGLPNRYYLGHNTAQGTFKVLPRLRRDAAEPSDNSSSASDTLRDERLHVPRHPRFSVVSGIDNFGAPVNAEHGVSLRNTGPAIAPAASITGERDSVAIYDGRRARTLTAPYDYRELFERICEAEARGGLFDISIDGIHPWELYRGAFIAKACEALGLWGAQFSASSGGVTDEYVGDKRLSDAPGFRRVLFEFPRKPEGVDPRTAAFHDDETMTIEYPQANGYSDAIHSSRHRFPIHEYNMWRSTADLKVPEVDPRPYEESLSAALGLRVDLRDQLEKRVRKFLEEREFWTPIFETVQPEEVVIPSSHWHAGVCAAAQRAGAQASDIQYALTSPLHPSFWFGDTPRHGATHLYAWAPMWWERTNAYRSRSYVPKTMPERRDGPTTYDVLVISQPRVSRRILQFVERLAPSRPDLRIAIAPHPDERALVLSKLASASLDDKVEIVKQPTIEAIQEAAICVGGYSTSLYEAAYFGKPTYVIPVPGFELLENEIDSGLFRLAISPEAVQPFDVPSWSKTIFGDNT